MKTKIYEINQKEVREIPDIDFKEAEKNKSSLYIIDIQSHRRQTVSEDLEKLGIPERICKKIHKPEEHIRFEYIEGTLYGEIAYFSPITKKSGYTAIIIHENILVGIHPKNEIVFSQVIKSFWVFPEEQKVNLNAGFLLYVLILEILSNYGKLILSYREKIELLALDFDEKNTDISPDSILESKTQLSIFSRVLERLYFTLSFPPTKDVLEMNSPYRKSFDYLLKSMSLLKISLKQTEDRLDSLNDHYQLLLHDRANKRLNLLTIIQAIFVPLTLIVGVYGMNFQNMPELSYKYGYFITIGGMAVVAFLFLRFFYKNGWFD